MKAILLSINPQYVERILSGEKKYEYRKKLARKDIDTIYIYSTFPLMKVVASVQVMGNLSASPTALWERTKKNAGITRAKYREYFHGCKRAYAYELGEVNIFDPPLTLSEFGLDIAPQSFRYIDI
ncbi:hypothetical protein AALA24_02840 [Anaerovoracaceae bacterium 42-11]